MTDTMNAEPDTKLPRKMAREPKPDATADAMTAGAVATPQTMSAPVKPQTKAARVEALLAREGGASLDELCQTTGWLPHTCRAFLTGLRKKGRALERSKAEDGTSIYTLVSAAGAVAPTAYAGAKASA